MDRSVIKWKEDMVKGWSRNLRYYPAVENCTPLGYYGASSGNFLPTFRDNLSVPSSGFKNPKGCPETSVRNYLYWSRHNPEVRSSQLLTRRKAEIRHPGI
jgi:hypothetical protein